MTISHWDAFTLLFSNDFQNIWTIHLYIKRQLVGGPDLVACLEKEITDRDDMGSSPGTRYLLDTVPINLL